MARAELLEISDLIVDFDVETLQRLPVQKQPVIDKLQSVGDRRAARIVAAMPAKDGVLDVDFVDQLLVRVHCEMQRLSEEFQHGRRVCQLLESLLVALANSGVKPPFRVVDIGCGTGFVIRWLAAHAKFDYDVELLGVDFNRGLINEASRLAEVEQLACRFEVANAFVLDEPVTVMMSTGVLHHFRDEALVSFFQQHDQVSTQAFMHFDFQPTILALPGAWMFHYIRMREPLSRHDGVVSARRAHTAATLLAAARQASYLCGIYSARFWRTPLQRVFHTLVGMRPQFARSFSEALGSCIGRWEPSQ